MLGNTLPRSRLPREVMVSPSLGVFKNYVAFGNVV